MLFLLAMMSSVTLIAQYNHICKGLTAKSIIAVMMYFQMFIP